MEKKNTILLTVIAVATLLVAVVGATFAYYSLSVKNAEGTVKVGAETDELGQIALTSETGTLNMTLLPANMADFKTVKDYYATKEGTLTEIAPNTEIAKVAFTTEGAKNTEYKCTSIVKVTLKNDEGTMGAALEQGDAAFVLTGSENVSISGQSQPISLDLSTLKGDGENTEEYTVIYTLGSNGTEKNVDAKLFADLKITNLQKEQNYLTDENDGKELTVTVQTTSFNCEIAKID